ncbi:MAG: HAMP domain-containing sensor histidine kinase [Pseudomonadota bacterium]
MLIGGEARGESLDDLNELLPLLIAALSAEHQLVLAAEDARDARDSEHRARTLAGALEQARAEAARLNAELSEEDRNKNEFLAMLAHELRNPLAPLVSSIAVLRLQYPDSLGQRTLDLMSRQVGHLSRLVEDLMDTSRVSQGKIDLRAEPVDLRWIVAAAVEENNVRFSVKNHRVTVTNTAEPLVVRGDPARLTQIFSNLLTNAAKYTDPSGDIRVTMSSESGHAAIEIADNGIGIDAAMLPRVFALFAQARGSLERAQGGLGIGLNLVKTLTELHAGTITASSPGLGSGSVFTVRIPLAQAQLEGR